MTEPPPTIACIRLDHAFEYGPVASAVRHLYPTVGVSLDGREMRLSFPDRSILAHVVGFVSGLLYRDRGRRP